MCNLFGLKFFQSCALFIWTIIFCNILSPIYAQQIQTDFGKNRVQYSDDFDNWSSYESDNFITYWYGKGKLLAEDVIEIAEFNFNDIQETMEHRMNDKIKVIVYTDIHDFYQTNIGLVEEKPEHQKLLDLNGEYFFVYFDGDYQTLNQQIRKGIARVFLSNMLYGHSISQKLKNSVSSDIPYWFKQGIISYIGETWTSKQDAQLRQYLFKQRRPIKRFHVLAKKHPQLAGQMFWYYIFRKYGKSSASNILYLSRINRSVPLAFQYIIGEEFETVMAECFTFFQDRLQVDHEQLNACVPTKQIDKCSSTSDFQALNTSPSASFTAYVENHAGRKHIMLFNHQTQRKKCIFSFGYKNNSRPIDNNYPILFWTKNTEELGIIFEKKNTIELRFFDLNSNKFNLKTTVTPSISRIYDADWVDPKNLVFVGIESGVKSLMLYNLNTRTTKPLYTFEKESPQEVLYTKIKNKDGYIVLSNKFASTTNPKVHDQSLYFITDTAQTIFSTNHADMEQIQIRDNQLFWLSSMTGIQAVHYSNLDIKGIVETNILYQCTHPIQAFSIGPKDQTILATKSIKSTVLSILDTPIGNSIETQRIKELEQATEENTEHQLSVDNLDSIPSGWFFRSKYQAPKPTEQANTTGDVDSIETVKINPLQITPHRLHFKISEMGSKLDNKPFFTGLNYYAGYPNGWRQNPMGLLFNMKVDELFNNYSVEGGIRVFTNLSGYDAYASYIDRKKRWDQRFNIYWKNQLLTVAQTTRIPERILKRTFLGQYEITYPFDDFQSIRFQGSIRNDYLNHKVSDQKTYTNPTANNQRLSIKTAYVFDNTSVRSINILHGNRSKVFVEFVNKCNIQVTKPYAFDLSTDWMSIFGMDLRHYIPIFKKSVLAFRLAGSTTLGSEQVLYQLGGVEQELNTDFEVSTDIPNINVAYQSLAPQMRGFATNIRNGSSFLLFNAECRIPVFRHLFSDELKLDFIREFQLVGFLDAGSAWMGKTPYSPENPINHTTVQNPVVSLDINYYRDPIVYGYGYGFRTFLLGYFIKMDVAYGIETKRVLPRRFHLSIGTDF